MSLRQKLMRAPGIAPALGWLGRRTQREQLLLAAMATVAVVAILILAIWNPMRAYRQTLLSEIAGYDEVLARVQMADPATLTARTGQLAGDEAPSIAGSAAGHGLLIRRIEPEGDNVRIAFEEADFLRILQWISDVDGAGTGKVRTVQIERRPAPGMVNAQVTLEAQATR